jgi:hypothetical protein
MTLNGWQDRLLAHFKDLRATILFQGTERPLFALEHGLNEEEFQELVEQLKEHVSATGPAEHHWLAWVVYAAEIGYTFAGDQYWQTFAAALPGWNRDDDRDFIKSSYLRFKREFRAAEPSGAWAKNFTIICWPIANAILPKDLQRHLAGVLFEISHLFSPALLGDPRALGALIEAHSEWTNSRFRLFAQQHALLGRIAAALLHSEFTSDLQLISPGTLTRITQDLQREQRSRDWLRDAKQRAAHTISLSGLQADSGDSIIRAQSPRFQQRPAGSDIRREKAQFTVRKRQEGVWALYVILPNFGALTQDKPQFQRVISTQRCFITGGYKAFFPARDLLYGEPEVELRELPSPAVPFLKFEDSVAGLSEFMEKTCGLPTFSTMLFRIRGDGAAAFVASQTLKTGRQYLIISTNELRSPGLQGSQLVSTTCNGLHALWLDVPEATTLLYREGLAGLNLGIANGLEVRPVGFPATVWNGDGLSSWREDDPKLLCIKSDLDIDGLVLNLVGAGEQSPLNIEVLGHEPTFVDLGLLLPGSYILHVIASVRSSTSLITGQLAVEITPTVSTLHIADRGQAFTVLTDPRLPTLEQMWSGQASLDIYGPEGELITCRLDFFSDSNGSHCAWQWVGPPIRLPISNEHWIEYLNKAKSSHAMRAAYDEAGSCTLTFRSLALGEHSLQCEREFIPFRWKVKRTQGSYHLCLIQNDSTEALTAFRYAFDTPHKSQQLHIGKDSSVLVSNDGGLYEAVLDGNSTAMVLPPYQINSFADLRPRIPNIAIVNCAEDLLKLMGAIKQWTEARFAGDVISTIRRDTALAALEDAFVASVCGKAWQFTEKTVRVSARSLSALTNQVIPGNDDGFDQLVFEARYRLVEATPAETATLLLALCARVSYELSHMSASAQQNAEQYIAVLLPLLKLNKAISENLPFPSRECAEFALRNGILMRLIRFATFCKGTSVDVEPLVVAEVGAQ